MINKTICAATFVSDTDHYTYPIDLWEKQLTGFDGVHIKNYPKNSVKKPSDIADFQNKVLKEVFNQGYDYCLLVQADIFFDSEKTDVIYAIANDSIKGHNHTFGIEDIKLFQYLYSHYFGISLISKYSLLNFIGDGAYPESHNLRDDVIAGYSMGYMSKDMFYGHKKSHSSVWDNVQYNELDNHSTSIKIPYTGVYKRMIDGLGVYDEYIRFKKIVTNEVFVTLPSLVNKPVSKGFFRIKIKR